MPRNHVFAFFFFLAAWLLTCGCVLPLIGCHPICCFVNMFSVSVCLPHSSFVQYRWRQWKPHRPGPQVSVSLIVTYNITEQVIYHSLPASPPLPSLPPGWMMLSELVTATSILSLCVCQLGRSLFQQSTAIKPTALLTIALFKSRCVPSSSFLVWDDITVDVAVVIQ